ALHSTTEDAEDAEVKSRKQQDFSSVSSCPQWLMLLFRQTPARCRRTLPMIVSALLSAVHVLTLALGLGAVFMRGRAMARPLDEAGWRRLLAADNAWGIAAALWIVSGLGRVFFGGKERAFCWHHGLFRVKLALFG